MSVFRRKAFSALKNWKDDYNEKYAIPKLKDIAEILEQEKWDGMNKLFRKWLSEQAEQVFGSQKEAAKMLDCETKTLRSAKG